MIKVNEKGMSHWATILVVAVIIVVLVIIFSGGEEANNNEELSENTQETESMTEKMEEGAVLAMVLGSENTQVIELLAVDESESSGAAYRLYEDGVLYHSVVATMPAPSEGNVYEGWLVQPDPLMVVSTGLLVNQEDSVWTLEFSSDQEYATYLTVVITEETVVDDTPERHVIEGSF